MVLACWTLDPTPALYLFLGYPHKARRYIVPSNTRISGIEVVSILVELICDITLGDHNSLVFKDLEILVTTSTTAILIDQNILNHDSLTSYSINNRNVMVEFRWIFPSDNVVE